MTSTSLDVSRTVLRAHDVTKRYGGTRALSGVGIELATDEVVGLLGGNGAGKSTLVKILTGVVQPDDGHLGIDGEPLSMRTPAQARRAGIGVVHQHTQLFRGQSVAWNMFVGAFPRRAGVFIDRRALAVRGEELAASVGVELDMTAPVESLDPPGRKTVEILRALAVRPRFLFLDEPTAALESRETSQLLALMRRLASNGTGIVFITHRLAEVLATADRVVALRDGAVSGQLARDALDADTLVRLVADAEVPDHVSPQHAPEDRVVIDLRGARIRRDAPPFDLTVRAGEIVSCVGLVGSGATALTGALVGAGTLRADSFTVSGRARPQSPRRALRAGVGFVPSDRAEAVQPQQSVSLNLIGPWLSRFSTAGWLRKARIRAATASAGDAFRIKYASLDIPISSLSGGNAQKVMIARWMIGGVTVLVLNEPTQGVDVLARSQIHQSIIDFAAAGGAVLIATTDLQEARSLSHRLLVTHGGQLVSEYRRDDGLPDLDALLATMTGVSATGIPPAEPDLSSATPALDSGGPR